MIDVLNLKRFLIADFQKNSVVAFGMDGRLLPSNSRKVDFFRDISLISFFPKIIEYTNAASYSPHPACLKLATRFFLQNSVHYEK